MFSYHYQSFKFRANNRFSILLNILPTFSRKNEFLSLIHSVTCNLGDSIWFWLLQTGTKLSLWVIEDFRLFCRNIALKAPFEVRRSPNELHYTYLDTIGRPVIIAHKTNMVENHIEDFEVSMKCEYRFKSEIPDPMKSNKPHYVMVSSANGLKFKVHEVEWNVPYLLVNLWDILLNLSVVNQAQ